MSSMVRLKYITFVLGLYGTLGMCTTLFGQGEQLFVSGNEAFTSGQYQAAVVLYDSSLRVGNPSAETYYNLGHTYEKLGQPGLAIWAYERALALAPRHEDATHNLAVVQNRLLDTPGVAHPWWDQLGPTFSQSLTWGWMALGGMFWVLAFGSLYIWSGVRTARKVGFYAAIGGLVLALGAAGLMWSIQQGEANQRFGVIISADAPLKEAPDGTETLLRLPEGSKLRWEAEMGPWIKVSYLDRAQRTQTGYIAAPLIRKI